LFIILVRIQASNLFQSLQLYDHKLMARLPWEPTLRIQVALWALTSPCWNTDASHELSWYAKGKRSSPLHCWDATKRDLQNSSCPGNNLFPDQTRHRHEVYYIKHYCLQMVLFCMVGIWVSFYLNLLVISLSHQTLLFDLDNTNTDLCH